MGNKERPIYLEELKTVLFSFLCESEDYFCTSVSEVTRTTTAAMANDFIDCFIEDYDILKRDWICDDEIRRI